MSTELPAWVLSSATLSIVAILYAVVAQPIDAIFQFVVAVLPLLVTE